MYSVYDLDKFTLVIKCPLSSQSGCAYYCSQVTKLIHVIKRKVNSLSNDLGKVERIYFFYAASAFPT